MSSSSGSSNSSNNSISGDLSPTALSSSNSENTTWVTYSQMDQSKFSTFMTAFSLGTSIITQPFNVITTRQQVGFARTGDIRQPNMIKAFQQALQNLGWKGLFRGLLPSASMGIPSQVIYITITEGTREPLQKHATNMFPSASPIIIDAIQAGATSVLANAASLISYVPGEVVSCRMMIQPKEGLGVSGMCKLVWQEEGIRGFYRGFNSSLALNIVFSAQWWWSYSVFRREGAKIDVLARNPQLLDGSTGLLAGLVSTVMAHPLDTVKTRIMTRTSRLGPHSGGAWMVLKDIVATEGYSALFRGIKASTTSCVLSSTLFAMSYELIKRWSLKGDDDSTK